MDLPALCLATFARVPTLPGFRPMTAPSSTSTARRAWLRPLGFIAFAIVALYAFAWIFDFAARKDLRSKAHWILSLQGGHYDFVVLGTSRPYLGVDVARLEKRIQGHGINLSLDGAGYPEQLLALRLFLQKNEIRQLLLDAALPNFDSHSMDYPFHDYEYLPYHGIPEIDAALRSECGIRAELWKYVPFWKNAEFNSKIGPIQLYTWCKSPFDANARVAEFDAHGTRLVDRPFHLRSELKPVRWTIEARQQAALIDILELAKSKGIRVTMILSPEWQNWSRLQLNRDDVLANCRKIAADHGIDFLVFDDLPFLNDTGYFIDSNHLNAKGAALYTDALAQKLQDSALHHSPIATSP